MRIHVTVLSVSEFLESGRDSDRVVLRDIPDNAPLRHIQQGQDIENIELHYEVGDDTNRRFKPVAFVIVLNDGSRAMNMCHSDGLDPRGREVPPGNQLSYVGSCMYCDGVPTKGVAHVYQRV